MKQKSNVLIGFIILNIFTGICSGIIALVLPLFASSIGASVVQVGIIKGISGIGALIMVLPSGMLVDNYGTSRLYIVGTIISTITTLSLAFFGHPEVIVFAMLIQGFSNSLRFTSLNAAFFGRLKEIGISKSGWYRGSLSIGLTFIGPLLGGYFVQYLEFKTIFCIAAILTLIPSIFMIMLEVGKKVSTQKIQVEKEKFHLVEQLIEFFKLFENKQLRNTVIIEGTSTACFSTFATFIVIYMVNILGEGAQNASHYFILEGTAYILSVFLLGGLLLKFQKRILYFASIFTMSIGLLLIGATVQNRIIVVGILLLGAGTGLLNILTFSNLGTIEGKKGKISSALSACTSIGASFGPMFGGIVGEIFGYNAIFLCYIPILLIVVALTQHVDKSSIREILVKE